MSAPPALHPLGVGELLDTAIYVYRKSFVTLIGIGAIVGIPIMLIQSAAALLNPSVNPFLSSGFTPVRPTLGASSFPFVYLAVMMVTGLLSGLASIFEIGAFAFVVSERRMGRGTTIGSAYRQALRRWTALVGSTLLIQLFTFACFALIIGPFLLASFAPLLAPGNVGLSIGATLLSCFSILLFLPAFVAFVYVAVRWSLAAPAIVLENLGALKGMGRSWRLVKGSFWRTLAVLAIIGVLVSVLTLIVTWSVQFAVLALLRNPAVTTIVSTASGSVVGIVIAPLQYAVITLLYYDLRVRREGYDLQQALDQLKQSTPPALAEGTA